MRALACLLGMLACAALAAGCGDDDDSGGGSSDSPARLVVSAASSMTEALEKCAPEFGDVENADVKLSFAGSDELAAQIRQGAPVDVYAAANTKLPDDLNADGLLEKPVEFATNEFVLAVPKGSEIDSIDDLTKQGTTVVIGSESVPIGAYTRETLAKLPPDQEKAILANVRSNEPDVKGIVGKLTQGAADAGFVYVTDVNATNDELKAIHLPADLEPQVTYGAGVVTQGEAAGPGAEIRRRADRRRLRRRAQRGRLRPGAVTRAAWFPVLLGVCLAVALTFLTLPVVAIFVDTSPGELISSLGEEGALDALWLSLKCTAAAIAIILLVGTPAAYLLATRSFRGRALVVTLIELPLVLPPAVAGIALLAAVGPEGILGGAIEAAGIQLSFATAGVVVALTFVSSPFYVRQAMAAFAAVDRSLLDASRTLGASEARGFLRVMIPVAIPGLAAGTALALGRALGEFGATLMFAGSFQGITQTVPLAIYDRFSTDFEAALALSAVLVAVSAAILLAVKLVRGGEALGVAPR